MANSSRTAIWLVATLAGCSNRPSETVLEAAESYVERLADTSRTDSTGPVSDELRLYSVTAGWTITEWQEFWTEVDKLRRR